MSNLDIIEVNRFRSDWDPKVLFTAFRVRAVLRAHEDMITRIDTKHRLCRKLRREMGNENIDWILQTNPLTNDDELYLQNTGKLLLWKLQDNMRFDNYFDRVEEHSDSPKPAESDSE